MAEIVNLRRVKKARHRAQQAEEAAAHRALHGRTPAERESQVKDDARARRLLDGARVIRDDADA